MAKKKNLLQENIEARKSRLLDAFKDHPFSVGLCCDIAGVSRQTYYDYLSNDPSFAAAVEQCKIDYKDRMLDLAESVHVRAMTESDRFGNVTAAGISAANYIKNNWGKDRGFNVKDQTDQSEQRPEVVIKVEVE